MVHMPPNDQKIVVVAFRYLNSVDGDEHVAAASRSQDVPLNSAHCRKWQKHFTATSRAGVPCHGKAPLQKNPKFNMGGILKKSTTTVLSRAPHFSQHTWAQGSDEPSGSHFLPCILEAAYLVSVQQLHPRRPSQAPYHLTPCYLMFFLSFSPLSLH